MSHPLCSDFQTRLRTAARNNCPYSWFRFPAMLKAVRSGENPNLPALIECGEVAAPCGAVASPTASSATAPAASGSCSGATLCGGEEAWRAFKAEQPAALAWLTELFPGLLGAVEVALRLQVLLADAKLAPLGVYAVRARRATPSLFSHTN